MVILVSAFFLRCLSVAHHVFELTPKCFDLGELIANLTSIRYPVVASNHTSYLDDTFKTPVQRIDLCQDLL